MRIIPITIITAILFAILKFVDISQTTHEMGAIISNVEAEPTGAEKKELMSKEEKPAAGGKEKKAEEKPADTKEAPKEEAAKKEAAKEGEAKPIAEGEHGSEGEGKEEKKNPNVSYDLDTQATRHYSESEIDLLKKLAGRHNELARWERNIQIKEEVLNATEKRVNERIDQIESMRKQVGKLLAEYNEKEDAKIRSLVKIYENMKPKDAARIFDEVEMPVLLLVLDKMSEKKAAPILAGMNPKKAKQITVELAAKRRYDAATLNATSSAVVAPAKP